MSRFLFPTARRLWPELVGAALGGEHPGVEWLQGVYRMVYGD